MSKLQDAQYLCNEQYKTSSNLDARIRLNIEFSTNPYGWFPWVFDHYHRILNPARILELGCGKGEYTIALARKNPNINYIGIDIKGARFWRGAKTAIEDEVINWAMSNRFLFFSVHGLLVLLPRI